MFDVVAMLRWGASLTLALAGGLLLLQGISRGSLRVSKVILASLMLLSAVLTAFGVAAAAWSIAGNSGDDQWQTVQVLATETWSGRVSLVRIGLALVAFILLLTPFAKSRLLAFLAVTSTLFLLPFSGHAVTAEPVRLSLALHGIHVSAVMLWAGGVVSLAVFAMRNRAEPQLISDLLRRFSPVALSLVVAGVLAGLVAGYLQAGAGAALIGTSYGRLLLLKSALLMAIALPCAGWLRWSYLHDAADRSPRFALILETSALLAITGVASWMSHSIPARHDDIVWPLPFRLDWSVLSPDRDGAYVLAGHLVFAAAMFLLALGGAVLRRWVLVWTTAGMGLLIGGLGLLNMFVPAYPTTFAALRSSYSATTLASAEPVFMDKCALCHGETGQGDGPAMQDAGTFAADLTAPHAGYHTPGDIYWWITHGFPDSAMWGVEDSTTEQQRWDLVNFLKLISYVARARDINGSVAPGHPLLPSINFGFESMDGGLITLRDLEGKAAVLLVINADPDSLARLSRLEEVSGHNGLTIALAEDSGLKSLLHGSNLAEGIIQLDEQGEAVLASWRRYLPTASHPQVPDIGSAIPHTEFLIDRFGYVRAKWRSDEGSLPSPEEISSLVRKLADEPKLLPSPEEHLH